MARKKVTGQGRNKPILWKKNEINMKSVEVICGIHTVRLRVPVHEKEINSWRNRTATYTMYEKDDRTRLRKTGNQFKRSETVVGSVPVTYTYNRSGNIMILFNPGQGAENENTDLLPIRAWPSTWPEIVQAMSEEIGVNLQAREIYLSRLDIAFDLFLQNTGLFIDSTSQLPKDRRALKKLTYHEQQSSMSRSKGETKALSFYDRTGKISSASTVRIELRALTGRSVDRALGIDRKTGDRAQPIHVQSRKHVDTMVSRILSQGGIFPDTEIVPYALAKKRVAQWPDSPNERYVTRRLRDKHNLVVGSQSRKTASITHLYERLMSAYEESWKK